MENGETQEAQGRVRVPLGEGGHAWTFDAGVGLRNTG